MATLEAAALHNPTVVLPTVQGPWPLEAISSLTLSNQGICGCNVHSLFFVLDVLWFACEMSQKGSHFGHVVLQPVVLFWEVVLALESGSFCFSVLQEVKVLLYHPLWEQAWTDPSDITSQNEPQL